VACDAVSQSARFVNTGDSDEQGQSHPTIQCHFATGGVGAIRASADATTTVTVSHPSAHETSVIDPDVVFPSALALATIVYLVYLLRQARRHGQPTNAKPSRCAAVDVFRGLTICLMVFVNYGGGGFALFVHSAWDGLTFADVVFPWCVLELMISCAANADRMVRLQLALHGSWVSRCILVLATAGLQRRGVEYSLALPSCLPSGSFSTTAQAGPNGAFQVSLSTWWMPSPQHLGFLSHSLRPLEPPGVLQSLSAGYLLTACLTRAVDYLLQQHGNRIRLGPTVVHSVVGILPLVAVNLALTFGLHVPGCPNGYLGPGGDSEGGRFRNCTGGAHLLIDRAVFGEKHIYQTPTCQAVFHTGPYDPEGLLNWLMVAATTYCGFLAGARFKATESSGRRAQIRASLAQGTVFLLAASVVSGVFGVFPRAQWIPLNKNLWSLSYVFVSIAVANVAFAGLHFSSATDHVDAHASLPWTSTWSHVGQNSIFIYTMVREHSGECLMGA
jgi:heparan-alpha-glucosaminide N-acetyltransferase